MKILKYQNDARTTAVYPVEAKIAYPTLGLIGELGEYLDKSNDPRVSNEDCLKELGDVLWYCANLCCDLELFLTDLWTDVDTHDGFELIPQEYLYIDDLAVLMGKAAEAAKKILRDGLTPERKDILKVAVATVMEYIAYEADDLDSSLTQVAEMNIAKLFDRMDRGTLRGDGDNR